MSRTKAKTPKQLRRSMKNLPNNDLSGFLKKKRFLMRLRQLFDLMGIQVQGVQHFCINCIFAFGSLCFLKCFCGTIEKIVECYLCGLDYHLLNFVYLKYFLRKKKIILICLLLSSKYFYSPASTKLFGNKLGDALSMLLSTLFACVRD